MSPARIIFLHGASSSGKSTLARALQARIEAPFWHISIDHLRDSGVLPTDRFRSGEFDWRAARAPFFDGFHRSLAAYAGAGNDLILEHILDTDGWLEQLSRLFAPFDVFFVGLHCPREELIRREAARGDRPAGSAARDFETVHEGKRYDLELQAIDPLADNVEALLAAWRCRSAPSAFDQLL
ncbi:chloramphenicol phosphotransferase CPT family protein [Pontivivens ytuae]|uniref:AAA family ATPase n=1 Tax=Pontivivens ytuae TaxID=2789856 RepID=A0A7S9QAW7_9RHOB|nr:AAA family ATPase [Pontivivens ytuae]QPH52518.1 AAA family ATPase [Pontivivens ytuae]